MAQTEKLYEQLDALEVEIKNILVSELPRVVAGDNTLFFHSAEYNPHNFPESKLPPSTQNIVDLAKKALRLRQKLQEPENEGGAALFLKFCERATNVNDAHRGGPSTLAKQLLAELEKGPLF